MAWESPIEEKKLDNLRANVDRYAVEQILRKLKGKGLLEASMFLTEGKSSDFLEVRYLAAIVEQNWIMIRQLNRIEKALCQEEEEKKEEELMAKPEVAPKRIALGMIIDMGDGRGKCPNCDKIQSLDRKVCYNCGMKFVK